MALSVRNFSENVKVMAAMSPKCCPPVDKLRSSIYHTDCRSNDMYSCTQCPAFIPTEEVLRVAKCKPVMPLYNMPRKTGPCGLKIINNDRRTNCCETFFCCDDPATQKTCPPPYPHRDINTLHANLRNPCCDVTGKHPIRPFLVCRQCGCTYQAKQLGISQRPCRLSKNSCSPSNSNNPISVQMNCMRPDNQENIIYFQANLLPSPPALNTTCPENSTQTKPQCPCSQCRASGTGAAVRIGDHFSDCNCQLCKRRKENCLNRSSESDIPSGCSDASVGSGPLQQNDFSSPVWQTCDNPDCDCRANSSSNSNSTEMMSPELSAFNLDLNQIQNESCQKVVIRGKDGREKAVPCHFCFTTDTKTNQFQPQGEFDNNTACSFAPEADSSCIPINGIAVGVNRNCSKRRNAVCGCFHCELVAKHKKALHGPTCCCLTCDKLRNQSKKRPNYYNSLRNKGCSSTNAGNDCYPQFSTQSATSPRCEHGALCACPANYMIPQALSPQQELDWTIANPELAKRQAPPGGQNAMVCPCHQFIPTNWERKVNCPGCPKQKMSKLPRASCQKKRSGVGDIEIGGFCPPVLVRSLKSNYPSQMSTPAEGAARKKGSCVSMGTDCNQE